jgi:hypothetical protein
VSVHLQNAELIRAEISSQLAHVRTLLARPLHRIEAQSIGGGPLHPLQEVLEAAERWVRRDDLATAHVEGYVVEATGLGPLITARSGDPALPGLLADMVGPDQYLHAVGVLGVAFAMQSLAPSTQVRLLRKTTQAPGYIADIRVTLPDSTTFDIEAKAPRILRGLRRTIRTKLARRAVTNAVSGACDPVRGQLPKTSPGVVAIASFGLGEASFAALVRAANRQLEVHRAENPLLMGVLIVDYRRAAKILSSTKRKGPGDSWSQTSRVSLTWGSHRELVRNPGYRGEPRVVIVDGHEPAKDYFDFSSAEAAPD